MPLNKTKGNMYDWITHTHNHLGGECPHKCVYCSIQDMQKRFPDLPYSGPLCLREKEFAVQYGSGKTIFIENCNDLFARQVPLEWVRRILDHSCRFPFNDYVFQTKNPVQATPFIGSGVFPRSFLFGCTVETNRENDLGNAPGRFLRTVAMKQISTGGFRTFITIEPIMDFDLDEFAGMIIAARPSFVNIGADSKGHGLPEPSFEKVMQLVDRLKAAGIDIREKRNLDRLKKADA
jgi:DNA repair photolyase